MCKIGERMKIHLIIFKYNPVASNTIAIPNLAHSHDQYNYYDDHSHIEIFQTTSQTWFTNWFRQRFVKRLSTFTRSQL